MGNTCSSEKDEKILKLKLKIEQKEGEINELNEKYRMKNTE
tara:strand:- start:391 stop:513 length:123 start_codon:yes stop_codon:yes gene_type:complete